MILTAVSFLSEPFERALFYPADIGAGDVHHRRYLALCHRLVAVEPVAHNDYRPFARVGYADDEPAQLLALYLQIKIVCDAVRCADNIH